MISENKVEEALSYIACNAERGGQLAGAKIAAEARIKAQTAIAFLDASGNNEVRKHSAEISEDVQRAKSEHAEAVAELETIRLRIKQAEAIISVYQTQSANNRRVNM